MLARLRELNWQTSGQRTDLFGEEDFAFISEIMPQNNNLNKTKLLTPTFLQ